MSEEQDAGREIANRTCDQCGQWVPEDEVLYELRVVLRAEPTAKVDDAGSDLRGLQREWEDLVEKMEGMSNEEVEEAADQVYEEYGFVLCGPCRKELHRRLKRRTLLP